MRATGASGGSDFADDLTLPDDIAFFHQQFGAVQKGTIESHAVVDHEQMALQREGIGCRERDDPICRGYKSCAQRGGDIHSAMIAARRPVINPLRIFSSTSQMAAI